MSNLALYSTYPTAAPGHRQSFLKALSAHQVDRPPNAITFGWEQATLEAKNNHRLL